MDVQSSGSVGLWIAVFLGVLFLAIGVLLILLDRRIKNKAEASLSWLETTGTVTESKINQSSNIMINDDEGESTPVFTPEIWYAYQVEGVDHSSKRLSFASTKSFSKRGDAERAAALYPVGTRLHIYYDPKNPNDAVVDRTVKTSKMVLSFGVVFIILGIATAVIGALLGS